MTTNELVEEREEEIIATLIEGKEAAQLLLEQHDELKACYPDQWVAVGRDGLVAHHENLEGLTEEYMKAGYTRNQVIVRLLETEPRLMIL